MEPSLTQTSIRQWIKTPRGYIYTAALLLSTGRYFLISVVFPRFTSGQRLLFSVLSFVFIILVWEGVHGLNRYLNRTLPFETGVLRRFLIQTVCCLIIVTPIQAFAITYFEDYFRDYIPFEFVTIIKIASYGLNLFIVTAVNTAFFGFYFFDKWKKNLIEKENWEKEKALLQKAQLNAQYENLKNQLNPHFLFNSLTSLNSLIYEDQHLASQFLQQLSRVFRYLLENREKELVSLETELNFINRYLFLLKTRFEDYFLVSIDVPAHKQMHQIVPVTLQILIENVVKHNSISEESPLQMRIYTEDTYLIIHNNKNPKNRIEHSNKLGLRNLQALYSYLSDKPLEITETLEDFTVRVPLL